MWENVTMYIHIVVTLALGSRSRQRVTRLRAKRKSGVMPHTPRSARKCEGMHPHTPKATPTWGIGDSKTSKSDYKGQNSSPLRFFYIIGKLLKFRCPKWARINHLDICNTSYDQKKGWESNWQFDSRPQKVGN
jgi:hypothetical protein